MKTLNNLESRFNQTLVLRRGLSMPDLVGTWLFAGMFVKEIALEYDTISSEDSHTGVYKRVEELKRDEGNSEETNANTIQVNIHPDYTGVPSEPDTRQVRGVHLSGVIQEAVSKARQRVFIKDQPYKECALSFATEFLLSTVGKSSENRGNCAYTVYSGSHFPVWEIQIDQGEYQQVARITDTNTKAYFEYTVTSAGSTSQVDFEFKIPEGYKTPFERAHIVADFAPVLRIADQFSRAYRCAMDKPEPTPESAKAKKSPRAHKK